MRSPSSPCTSSKKGSIRSTLLTRTHFLTSVQLLAQPRQALTSTLPNGPEYLSKTHPVERLAMPTPGFQSTSSHTTPLPKGWHTSCSWRLPLMPRHLSAMPYSCSTATCKEVSRHFQKVPQHSPVVLRTCWCSAADLHAQRDRPRPASF